MRFLKKSFFSILLISVILSFFIGLWVTNSNTIIVKETNGTPINKNQTLIELKQKLLGLKGNDVIIILGKPSSKSFIFPTDIAKCFMLYKNNKVENNDGSIKNNIFIQLEAPMGWGNDLTRYKVVEIIGTNKNTINDIIW